MQAAKKAVETIKETAANIGASAKSGFEKTKATVQEKAEKMSAHDPVQKDMATEKKVDRINQAEMEKQEAREHNAAAKQSVKAGHVTEAQYTTTGPATQTAAAYSTTGGHGVGHPMGANQMSTTHGHGIGHPVGTNHMSNTQGLGNEELSADMVGSHPIGTNTGLNTTMAHNIPGGNAHGPGSGPNLL